MKLVWTESNRHGGNFYGIGHEASSHRQCLVNDFPGNEEMINLDSPLTVKDNFKQ